MQENCVWVKGIRILFFYDHFTLVSFSFFPDHSSVFLRRFLRLFLALAFVSVVAVFCINVWILQSTEYSIYTDLQSVPEKQAVLVLGSRVYSTGQVSTILADRLDASVDLYQAKKVQKILVSGDHGTDGYDEANAMRKYLLRPRNNRP
jgi:SanA protein